MIIPELKGTHIMHEDWENDIDDFYVCLDAFIGEKDKDGPEVFRFHIISAKRLIRISKDSNEVEVGRVYLITPDFSLPQIEGKIKQLLTNCKRENWDETIHAISRYGIWEDES